MVEDTTAGADDKVSYTLLVRHVDDMATGPACHKKKTMTYRGCSLSIERTVGLIGGDGWAQ